MDSKALTGGPVHRRPRELTLALATAAALALGALAPVPAGAQPAPETVPIDDACPASARAADPFDDVEPGGLHAGAIGCLWVYGIAAGVGVRNDFGVTNTITREQMATFVAATLDLLTDDVYALPETRDDALYDDTDDISDAHLPHVNQLTDAGIVRGYGDGTFRPRLPVTREQMATYLVTAIEAATGQELPRTESFDDVADTHQPSVEKLASIGATAGTGDGNYSPRLPVTRQQMASFVARTLNHLVTEGLLEPIAYRAATSALLGITDIEVSAHDGYDRVTFTLEGDDGEVGFRARYVDDPRSAGSGFEVDVDGQAVLHLSLQGMAIPDDLPEDVRDRLWQEERVTVDGAGIVEIVDDSIFEGQQELFLGTTGVNAFDVAHLEDPQRVVVEVQHD